MGLWGLDAAWKAHRKQRLSEATFTTLRPSYAILSSLIFTSFCEVSTHFPRFRVVLFQCLLDPHFFNEKSRDLQLLEPARLSTIGLSEMQTLRRSRSNFSIKSKFSTHGQSDNWHRQISLEAGDQHPIGPGYVPNTSFPWTTLRQITDSYLAKKRGKITVEDRDACLIALIRNYAAKDIAIAACAHAMSPKAVRDLLTVDLNIEPGDSFGLPSYLQAIIAANHVNEGAVSALEAQRAIELMASSNASAGRYLERLLQILINGVPANFLIYSHIQTLARLACVEFAAQVERLRHQCQWRRAQAATEWLSRFVQRSVESLPENLDSTQILYANFPHWCAWANWNPDVARIGRWELFSPMQRATLTNALALEGPDYISDRHATLREAVEAQGFIASQTRHSVASIVFEVGSGFANDVPNMVDRLLRLVDAAVVTSENDGTAILAYFCISQSVTNRRLDCLECLSHLADPSISALVSQAYRARNESWGAQMAAVMRLLPILGIQRLFFASLLSHNSILYWHAHEHLFRLQPWQLLTNA